MRMLLFDFMLCTLLPRQPTVLTHIAYCERLSEAVLQARIRSIT
uniref:Uncharacterized protein n=1 Tax=Anguilla anguilla TaxID=7936 RepID=A0A0E9WDQ0_ANGAN